MKEKCCSRVWDDTMRSTRGCDRSAKYEVGGKRYCGTHNPEAVARREQRNVERWERNHAAFVGEHALRKRNAKNAARYLWLRDRLYSSDVGIGEALVRFQVIGSCPDTDEFDAEIDKQMAEDDRYTLTEAGRAMLRDAQQGAE